MDKVQIYTVVMVGLNTLLSMILFGIEIGYDEIEKAVSVFLTYMLSSLISLPIVGRIFGWW
jgi:hypothetical protein